MPKGSWKTTLCGGLAIAFTGASALIPAPYSAIARGLAIVATALGNMFSRDNDKSSEQVGAGNTGAERKF